MARGAIVDVALAAKSALDANPNASVVIFNSEAGQFVEVDFRGTAYDVAARLATPVAQPDESQPVRGRPKLGVVAREVTLLPRHWEWLNSQPGGASVALRKLVEAARKDNAAIDEARRSREAAYRFMSVVGGDFPGFEEATRALFAGNKAILDALLALWPMDIRNYVRELAEVSFSIADASAEQRLASIE